MKTLEQLQNDIEMLESRNAFQDDVIEQLSEELAVHQAELSDIKNQLKLLATRIKDANPAQSDTTEIEPPPPHY